jgi:sec-independent protein translocase protein TatA
MVHNDPEMKVSRKIAALSLAVIALGGCSLGPTELLIILAIIVLLFGASRLPQLGKALGDTVKSFRQSTKGDEALPEEKEKRDVVQIEEAKVDRGEPEDKDKPSAG